MAGGSHEVVPLEGGCPIASPKLNEVLAGLREKVHDPRWPRFVRAVELFTNEHDVQVNVVDSEKPVARRFYEWLESAVAVDYATSAGTFRVSPKSFFQVNRFLIDPLVDAAVGGQGGEVALDLYAGAGLFALPLAKRFKKVIGVEGGSAAAHDLRFNAERAGVAVDAVYSRVEDFLTSYEGTADFVLADPPRAGLGPVAPPRLILMGAVLIAALGAGGGLCYLLAQLKPTFTSRRALSEAIGLPVIGAVSYVLVSPAAQRSQRVTLLSFGAAVAGLMALFAILVLLEMMNAGLHDLLKGAA